MLPWSTRSSRRTWSSVCGREPAVRRTGTLNGVTALCLELSGGSRSVGSVSPGRSASVTGRGTGGAAAARIAGLTSARPY